MHNQQQQLDLEREEFERWAASTYGVVTASQYNIARDAYLEGARQERARHARLMVIRDEAVGAAARQAFDQLVADGEGRN